jgi:hypothetical protein
MIALSSESVFILLSFSINHKSRLVKLFRRVCWVDNKLKAEGSKLKAEGSRLKGTPLKRKWVEA